MLALVVDTSTPAISAAVARVKKDACQVLAASVTVDSMRHGEQLTPSIKRVCDESGCEVTRLSAVVAGLGPGPFTGLRVGLVTAAAFADAMSIPAYGVCSLDAIAQAVVINSSTDSAPFLVATDARRREVYWAAYDGHGNRLIGPEVNKPNDVARRLPDFNIGVAYGAGALAYAEVLGLPVRLPHYPDLAAMAELARDRILSEAPTESLTPLYLRRPDATEPQPSKQVTPA